MITYHAIGYYGLPALIAACVLLRTLTPGTPAHQFVARTTLTGLGLVALTVYLAR
ncbi:hypothetical protein ACWD4V_13915 [Streptomyces tsukubensis]